ncbi:hypothetical protein CDD81_1969 [Ophiocordyceps australis]|uniref:Uncharacterized protein n=1 Tax=Ophiocordyceps australis TaxID=1399860 RepID=A0A2C5X7U4_9HYPO|nr:hypothetical protein CDD81_1969 [Ophiocordyceps australis]
MYKNTLAVFPYPNSPFVSFTLVYPNSLARSYCSCRYSYTPSTVYSHKLSSGYSSRQLLSSWRTPQALISPLVEALQPATRLTALHSPGLLRLLPLAQQTLHHVASMVPLITQAMYRNEEQQALS